MRKIRNLNFLLHNEKLNAFINGEMIYENVQDGKKSNDENITLTPRPHVKLTQSKSN